MATAVEAEETVATEATPARARKGGKSKLDQLDIFQPEATKHLRVQYIPREQIHPDPTQPRQEPDAELRASIARNGILQPITVRSHPDQIGQYLLVAGERRWKGAEGVQALIPCLVRDDLEERSLRLQTQLVENTNKPLTPIEEARAYQELMGRFPSVAALAKELGRPETTVRERLDLMQLGPWIAAIEQGFIPVSFAVRALAPLRGCSDEVHAEAIASLFDKTLSNFEFDDQGALVATFDDFEREIRQLYKVAMYPLTKTKADNEPQPTFDTRNHDAECPCGRIQFALGWNGAKRACCGNAAWWRPLDAAAKKAEKAKQRAQGPDRSSGSTNRKAVRMYAPAGATVKKVTGYDLPKGVLPLTDRLSGAWIRSESFDPSAVELEDAQLVFVKLGDGNTVVGTTDTKAIAKAKAAFKERWDARHETVTKAIAQTLRDKAKEYRASGPGIAELLVLMDYDAQTQILDVAKTLGIDVPAGLNIGYGIDEPKFRRWVGDLEESDASKLASAFAAANARKIQLPGDKVLEEMRQERERVVKRQVPWAKKPKGWKDPAAVAANDVDEEDAGDDE